METMISIQEFRHKVGGRWLSIDPQQRKYPNESNYVFTSDNPIIYDDADGKDKIYTLTIIDRWHEVASPYDETSVYILLLSMQEFLTLIIILNRI